MEVNTSELRSVQKIINSSITRLERKYKELLSAIIDVKRVEEYPEIQQMLNDRVDVLRKEYEELYEYIENLNEWLEAKTKEEEIKDIKTNFENAKQMNDDVISSMRSFVQNNTRIDEVNFYNEFNNNYVIYETESTLSDDVKEAVESFKADYLSNTEINNSEEQVNLFYEKESDEELNENEEQTIIVDFDDIISINPTIKGNSNDEFKDDLFDDEEKNEESNDIEPKLYGHILNSINPIKKNEEIEEKETGIEKEIEESINFFNTKAKQSIEQVNKKIKNLSIIYKNGFYKLKCDIYKDSIPTYFEKKHKLKNFKSGVKDHICRKYNIGYEESEKIDINLLAILESFDKEQCTTLASDYIKSNLDAEVEYDFRKSTKNLKISQRISQYIIANNQKNKINAYIYHPINKFAGLAVGAMLGLSIIGTSIFKEKSKNIGKAVTVNSKYEKEKNETKKTDTETVIENDKKVKKENTNNKFFEEKKSQIISTEQNDKNNINVVGNNYDNLVTLEQLENSANNTEEEKNQDTENIQTTESNKQEDKTEIKYDIYDDYDNNEGQLGFGIGDKLRLVNKDKKGNIISSYKLSADAWGNGDICYASDLDCDYFRISSISVYCDSDMLETIYFDNENSDVRTNALYKKYGSDIDIAFNFNGYYDTKQLAYEYAGWINIDEFTHFTDEQKEKIANSGDAKTLINKK